MSKLFSWFGKNSDNPETPTATHALPESREEKREHVTEAYNEAGQRVEGHPLTKQEDTGESFLARDSEALTAHESDAHPDSENVGLNLKFYRVAVCAALISLLTGGT